MKSKFFQAVLVCLVATIISDVSGGRSLWRLHRDKLIQYGKKLLHPWYRRIARHPVFKNTMKYIDKALKNGDTSHMNDRELYDFANMLQDLSQELTEKDAVEMMGLLSELTDSDESAREDETALLEASDEDVNGFANHHHILNSIHHRVHKNPFKFDHHNRHHAQAGDEE